MVDRQHIGRQANLIEFVEDRYVYYVNPDHVVSVDGGTGDVGAARISLSNGEVVHLSMSAEDVVAVIAEFLERASPETQ